MAEGVSGQMESAVAEEGARASGIDSATLTDDQRAALSLMEEVCAASQQDCRPLVTAAQSPYLYIELVGGDVHATWGRMGKALDSLQLICNTILSRRIRSDVRIVLDADQYRERRAEALRIRAIELAQEVKDNNMEAEFEPLPPHERRIIHTALADDPDIQTYSEGEEPDRRIVITPRRS